jgi:Tol biopolymer transport system component
MKKNCILNTIYAVVIILIPYACEDQSVSVSDSTPPTVSITSPVNDSTVAGIVNIVCEASDNEGIKKVELLVDGAKTHIADNGEPYVLQWQTENYMKNSMHEISAEATDINGNTAMSDTIVLRVDNSFLHATGIPRFISIEYDCSQMTIKWFRSVCDDFARYELFTSNSPEGTKNLLSTKFIQTDTTCVLTSFDPSHETWYWLRVTDTLGYTSYYSDGYVILDSPPDSSEIFYIKYKDGNFNLFWSANNDDDFNNYQLLESVYEDFSDARMIYSSTNRRDTMRVVENVSLDENRYYRVVVTDCWNLSTESKIRKASSYALIVYCSFKDGNSDLFIRDIDGENELQITRTALHELSPIFSPDGSTILYLRDGNLYLTDKYGENHLQLTANRYNHGAEFSADGSKIVFSSNWDGNWELYSMNPDGTQQTRLTYNAGYDDHPVYTPPGDKIAFISEQTGYSEVFLMDTDGANPVQLTADSLPKEQLQISLDGTALIYVVTEMPGMEDIYYLTINSKQVINLTESGTSEYAPVFSPAGLKIYYQAMSADWDIWVMDLDGSNKVNISNQNRDDTSPDILYDGSLIVFQSRVGSTSQIFTIDHNGNQLKPITDGNYFSDSPKLQRRQ